MPTLFTLGINHTVAQPRPRPTADDPEASLETTLRKQQADIPAEHELRDVTVRVAAPESVSPKKAEAPVDAQWPLAAAIVAGFFLLFFTSVGYLLRHRLLHLLHRMGWGDHL